MTTFAERLALVDQAADVDDVDELDARAQSWRPVDLGAVLDGTYEPPTATVGERADGVGLFYPGRNHSIVAEPEAGKTWFALHVARTEMERGHPVLFLDFEDEVGATIDRLLSLGCSRETVRTLFRYVQPGAALSLLSEAYLDDAVHGCSLAILDGVTEAMSLHGLSPLDNSDVARFWRMLPRRLSLRGPATLMLDHVVKDRESRGRWAIGGQHKLAGLNGAQYMLERVHPFGRGMRGVSRVTVAKDRPGQIRPHTRRMAGDRDWFADLVLDGTQGPLIAELTAPPEEQAGPFRPTEIMKRVSDAIADAKEPLTSQRAIEARVTGKAEVVRIALARLVDEGYVVKEPKIGYRLERTFTGES